MVKPRYVWIAAAAVLVVGLLFQSQMLVGVGALLLLGAFLFYRKK